jgi:hypothetical protein
MRVNPAMNCSEQDELGNTTRASCKYPVPIDGNGRNDLLLALL